MKITSNLSQSYQHTMSETPALYAPSFGVTKKTYNKIATFQKGVGIEDFNKSISDASATSHTLLYADRVKPTSNRNNNFYDYTCVFDGEGSPPVNNSFTVFPIKNSLIIPHCMF